MGLFNFFKKEKSLSNENKYTLEQLLEMAAKEPAYRADFYKRLLTDELVVITNKTNLSDGDHVLKEATKVNIVSFPDKRIPVFTSVQRIFDKGIIKDQVPYMQFKGADLFE